MNTPQGLCAEMYGRLGVSEAAALSRGEAAILPVGRGPAELILGLVEALEEFARERLGRGGLVWFTGDGLLVARPRVVR